jgi:flagellar motor switch protein FliN/FliY
MIMFPQGDFVLSSYPLTYDGNAYTLWECLGGDAAEGLTKALGGGGADDTAGLTPIDLGGMNAAAGGAAMGTAAPMGGAMPQMGGAMPNMGMGMQQPMGGMQQMGMGMPMGGMGMGMPQNMGVNMGMNVPNVQQLQYPNLQAGLNAGEQGNISLIMDVFMEMTVELGRTKKTIKDILGMGEGTIIELDKLAGEPVDILVNHKKIAKGEVVVIDENFGVRVTEILSPMERVTELN